MKNWIIKVLKAPLEFFKNLFKNGPEGFMKLIEKIAPVVDNAYPVVKKIAELTPTKTDDKILAAYEHFRLKELFDANKDKSLLLRDLAKQVIKEKNPDPLNDYLLNTAVELAYAKYKEENK